MTVKSFELLNVATGVGKASWNLSAEHGITLAGASDWNIELRRMRGGKSDGIEVITLNNGALEIEVLTTRGMGIWRGMCDGTRLGWDSPVALPVHPAYVNQESRDQLGWLDGFNEWLVRCGLAFNGPPGADDDGTPITLHGRIANQAAHLVTLEIDDEGQGEIRLTGVVDEASLFGTNLRLTSTISLMAGEPTIRISDQITNRGSAPQEFEMLYHLNQGTPILAEGADLSSPFKELAPRDPRSVEGLDNWSIYGPPEAGYAEQAYFVEPLADETGHGQVLLKNRENQTGMHVRFAVETLPWLTIWKCTQDERDGYVTGLEPGTDFPNHRSFERKQGRLRSLDPGESETLQLEINIARNEEELNHFEAEIDELQETFEPVIHDEPQGKYSKL